MPTGTGPGRLGGCEPPRAARRSPRVRSAAGRRRDPDRPDRPPPGRRRAGDRVPQAARQPGPGPRWADAGPGVVAAPGGDLDPVVPDGRGAGGRERPPGTRPALHQRGGGAVAGAAGDRPAAGVGAGRSDAAGHHRPGRQVGRAGGGGVRAGARRPIGPVFAPWTGGGGPLARRRGCADWRVPREADATLTALGRQQRVRPAGCRVGADRGPVRAATTGRDGVPGPGPAPGPARLALPVAAPGPIGRCPAAGRPSDQRRAHPSACRLLADPSRRFASLDAYGARHALPLRVWRRP